jgi:hemerythrin-like metal-binding protein
MTTTNIDIFQWNDKYETGIEIIDQQHQQLIGLLNQLINHLAQQASFNKLNSIFDELKNYTLYHFQTEEAVWKQYF